MSHPLDGKNWYNWGCDQAVIMETMDEVNRTTHDEYGFKAGGVLATLEKFKTLFSLKLFAIWCSRRNL